MQHKAHLVFFLGWEEDEMLQSLNTSAPDSSLAPTLLSTSVSDGGESGRAGSLPISAAAACRAGGDGRPTSGLNRVMS